MDASLNSYIKKNRLTTPLIRSHDSGCHQQLTTSPTNLQFSRGSCLKVRLRAREPQLWQRAVVVLLLHPHSEERFPQSRTLSDRRPAYSLIFGQLETLCMSADFLMQIKCSMRFIVLHFQGKMAAAAAAHAAFILFYPPDARSLLV